MCAVRAEGAAIIPTRRPGPRPGGSGVTTLDAQQPEARDPSPDDPGAAGATPPSGPDPDAAGPDPSRRRRPANRRPPRPARRRRRWGAASARRATAAARWAGQVEAAEGAGTPRTTPRHRPGRHPAGDGPCRPGQGRGLGDRARGRQVRRPGRRRCGPGHHGRLPRDHRHVAVPRGVAARIDRLGRPPRRAPVRLGGGRPRPPGPGRQPGPDRTRVAHRGHRRRADQRRPRSWTAQPGLHRDRRLARRRGHAGPSAARRRPGALVASSA